MKCKMRRCNGEMAQTACGGMIMGHWITDGKTKIGWDMFPDRKKPAICITECDSNVVNVYGYFKDEETAHAFMDRLASLVDAKPAEVDHVKA